MALSIAAGWQRQPPDMSSLLLMAAVGLCSAAAALVGTSQEPAVLGAGCLAWRAVHLAAVACR